MTRIYKYPNKTIRLKYNTRHVNNFMHFTNSHKNVPVEYNMHYASLSSTTQKFDRRL